MKPLFFETPAKFRAWLKKHHQTEDELLVGFYKKASGKPSMTWQESVDEALCFGWIDGIKKSYGEDAYTHRFTPRRKGSIWSSVIIARVKELTKLRRMQPAGLEAYGRRTEAKSRIYAYEQTDILPLDKAIERTFKANKKAWDFFQGQAPYYRKVITRWLNAAKAEDTRLRRLAKLMASCEQGRRM